MCGRVVVGLDSASLMAIARASGNMRNSANFRQSYNMAPGRCLPSAYKNESNEYCLEAMKWGTKSKDNNSIVNARSENVALFYKNWKRCTIIIDGYFEWKKIPSQMDSEKIISTQPYYIHSKGNTHLILAGVYRKDQDETNLFEGKEVLIITINANKQVEHIHDRMPCLLNDALVDDYLIGDMSYDEIFDKSQELDLALNSYPVGDLVSKLSNYGKDNILHKDEIKYDKNKNLKLTNFFKKSDNIKVETVSTKSKELTMPLEAKTDVQQKIISEDSKQKTEHLVINDNNEKDDGIKISSHIKSKIDAKENTIIKKSKKRKSDASPDSKLSKSRKKVNTSANKDTSKKYDVSILNNFLRKK